MGYDRTYDVSLRPTAGLEASNIVVKVNKDLTRQEVDARVVKDIANSALRVIQETSMLQKVPSADLPPMVIQSYNAQEKKCRVAFNNTVFNVEISEKSFGSIKEIKEFGITRAQVNREAQAFQKNWETLFQGSRLFRALGYLPLLGYALRTLWIRVNPPPLNTHLELEEMQARFEAGSLSSFGKTAWQLKQSISAMKEGGQNEPWMQDFESQLEHIHTKTALLEKQVSGDLQPLMKEWSDSLVDHPDWKEKFKGVRQLATFPFGYYHEGQYHPLIVNAVLSEDKKLSLQVMDLVPVDGRDEVPVALYEILGDPEEIRSQLMTTFLTLVEFSRPPVLDQKQNSSVAQKQLEVLSFLSGGKQSQIETRQRRIHYLEALQDKLLTGSSYVKIPRGGDAEKGIALIYQIDQYSYIDQDEIALNKEDYIGIINRSIETGVYKDALTRMPTVWTDEDKGILTQLLSHLQSSSDRVVHFKLPEHEKFQEVLVKSGLFKHTIVLREDHKEKIREKLQESVSRRNTSSIDSLESQNSDSIDSYLEPYEKEILKQALDSGVSCFRKDHHPLLEGILEKAIGYIPVFDDLAITKQEIKCADRRFLESTVFKMLQQEKNALEQLSPQGNKEFEVQRFSSFQLIQRSIESSCHVDKKAVSKELQEICRRSDDPWDQMLEFNISESRQKEGLQEQKLAFETNVLFDYLEALITDIDLNKLSPSQKEIAVLRAEKMLEKISTKYAEVYGSHQVFRRIWMSHFSDKNPLERIKVEIESIHRNALKKMYNSLDTVETSSQNFSEELYLKGVPSRDQKKITSHQDDLRVHLNSLKEIFSVDVIDHSELTIHLKSYQDACLSLRQQKRYKELGEAVTEFNNLLPLPRSLGKDSFWELIPNESLSLLSTSIRNMNHMLLESQLKTNQAHIFPDQGLGVIAAQAVLMKIIRVKVEIILSELDLDASASVDQILEKAEEKGISKEDLGLLAFRNRTTNCSQMRSLILEHPYLRYTTDPVKEAEILEMAEFLKEESRLGKPVTLDSWANLTRFSKESGDQEFLDEYMALMGIPKQNIKSVWSSNFDGKEGLPSFVHDLRCQSVCMQCLFHPESSLNKAFSSPIESLNWVKAYTQKVAQLADNIEDQVRLGGILERQERSSQIQEMGDLKFIVRESVEDDVDLGIQLTDRKGTYKFEYQPTGTFLVDTRDRFHDRQVIGWQEGMPESLFHTVVSSSDSVLKGNGERLREQSHADGMTEVSLYRRDAFEDSLERLPSNLRVLLKSLEVSRDGEISSQTVANALYVILEYSTYCDDPIVQKRIEQVLLKTGVLSTFFKENPSYLETSKVPERLHRLIERSIFLSRKESVVFFLQTAHLLKLYAKHSEVQGYDLLPDYSKMYRTSSQDESLLSSGVDLLSRWAQSEDENPGFRKVVYTQILMHYKSIDSFEELGEKDWALLLHAHAYVKNMVVDKGNMFLQREVLQWFSHDVLPYFAQNLGTETSRDKILDGLENQGKLLSSSRQLFKRNWEQDPQNPYIYKHLHKKTEINIETGLVSDAKSEMRFEGLLPEHIVQNGVFVKLFGQQNFTSKITRLQGSVPGLQYEFTSSGKRDFKIVYHESTGELTVFQKISWGQPPKEGWYEYVIPTGEEKGEFALVRNEGCWIDPENKKQALVILGKKDSWKAQDVLVFGTKVTGTQGIKLVKGKGTSSKKKSLEVYHDVHGRYREFCSFAPSEDVLFLRDPKTHRLEEIRFVSKGVTLTRNASNKWECGGDLSGYTLIQDPIKLEALQNRYARGGSSFLLPLEKIDRDTKEEEVCCVLWPSGLKMGLSQGDLYHLTPVFEENGSSSSLPLLKVYGKSGAQVGDISYQRSTATGFLYLAYASLASGDYEKAVCYLEKAQESPFDLKEKEVFDRLESLFSSVQDTTLLGMSCLLKAKLAMRQIKRDHLSQYAYAPLEWRQYIKDLRQDVKLYRAYEAKAEGCPDIYTPLLLKSSESLNFEALIEESMEFLVVESSQNPGVEIPQKVSFVQQKISTSDLRELSKEMLIHVRPYDASVRLENISIYASKKEILGHFFTYMKQIMTEEICVDDWRIQKLMSLDLSLLDEQSGRQVELARQVLIEVAHFYEKEGVFLKRKEDSYTEVQRQEISAYKFTKAQMLNIKAKDILKEEREEPVVLKDVIDLVAQPNFNFRAINRYQNLQGKGGLSFFDLIGGAMSRGSSEQEETKIVCCLEKLMVLVDGVKGAHDIFLSDAPRAEESSELAALFKSHYKGNSLDVASTSKEDEYKTNLAKMKEAIGKEGKLSKKEALYWKKMIEKIEEKEATEESYEIVQLMEAFLQEKIHTMSMRHEAVSSLEIEELERETSQMKPSVKEDIFVSSATHDELALIEGSKTVHEDFKRSCFGGVKAWDPSEEQIKQLGLELEGAKKAYFGPSRDLQSFKRLYEQVSSADDVEFLRDVLKSLDENESGFSQAKRFALRASAHIRLYSLLSDDSSLGVISYDLLPQAFSVLKSQEESVIGKIREIDNRQSYEKVTKWFNQEDPRLSSMEKKENELILKGALSAYEEKSASLKSYPGIIKRDQVGILKEKVLFRREGSLALTKSLKEEILAMISQNAERISVFKTIQMKSQNLSQEDAFEFLLDLYQRGKLDEAYNLSELRGSLDLSRVMDSERENKEIIEDLERLVTRFLYAATQTQQLSKALKDTSDLERYSLNCDESRLPIDESFWNEQSQTIYMSLEGASRRDRYLEIQEDKIVLKDSSYSRKHLVAEFRHEVIARDFQPVIVKDMVENPDLLVLLRPGAGKSKWITPEIAFLLAEEKGKFPVVLVTSELVQINRQDFGKTNREIFRQASHIFDFDRTTPSDITYLKDEYKRLLEAKKSSGYVVTTLDSLAALENELSMKWEELSLEYSQIEKKHGHKNKFLQKLESDSEAQNDYQQLVDLQEQRYWLGKIRALFHSEETQFVADEVDDIFNINRDHNYSVGETRSTTLEIRQGMDCAMMTICTHPGLQVLRESLVNNQQDTLSKDEIKDCMNVIAGHIYDQEAPFGLEIDQWSDLKSKISREDFINFVSGKPVDQTVIDSLWNKEISGSIETHPVRYLCVMKHLLSDSGTLMGCLHKQRADVSFGLGLDGVTVVPVKNGQVVPNTRYGDEYELIVYHYLYYASKSPSFDYFKDQWKVIEDKMSAGTLGDQQEMWEQWMESSGCEDADPKDRLEILYRYFKSPDSLMQRLSLLRHDVLVDRVKLYAEQVICNSQDVLTDCHVSGASGTVNEYALPEKFVRSESVYSRHLSGDTFLLIAGMDPRGFDRPVGVFDNSREFLLEKAADVSCKSIIDQGACIEELDSQEVVAMMRERFPHRQYLFVDPKTRKQVMWNPGEPSPVPYRADKIDKDSMTYFGPADTRGTDFKIPTGNAALITGAKTVDEDYLQAVWRLRRLGKGQNVEHFVSSSVAKKLGEPLLLGGLINSIKRSTLEEKGTVNLKAQSQGLRHILSTEVKKSRFAPYINLEGIFDDKEKVVKFVNNIERDRDELAILRPLFFKERKVNFQNELTQSHEVDCLEFLEDSLEQEKKKSEDVLNKCLKLPNSDFTKKKGIARKGLYEEWSTTLGEYDNKLDRLRSQKDMHKDNLPSVVMSSSVEQGGGQDQVQEQQQQQQQMLMQDPKASKSRSKSSDQADQASAHKWLDWPEILAKQNPSSSPSQMVLKGRELDQTIFPQVAILAQKDCGFYPHMIMTDNYRKIYESQQDKEGDVAGRLVVIQDSSGEILRSLIIDKLDYEKGLSQGLKALRDSGDDDYCIAICDIHTQSVDAKEIPFSVVDGSDSLPQMTNIRKEVVQAKLLCGGIEFGREEELVLNEFISTLTREQKNNLREHILQVRGCSSIVEIPSWNVSALGKLLK